MLYFLTEKLNQLKVKTNANPNVLHTTTIYIIKTFAKNKKKIMYRPNQRVNFCHLSLFLFSNTKNYLKSASNDYLILFFSHPSLLFSTTILNPFCNIDDEKKNTNE